MEDFILTLLKLCNPWIGVNNLELLYDMEVNAETVQENLDRICNQIFKLLPMREEEKDYLKPIETLIVEIWGMASLIADEPKLFSLVCKLEGLRVGQDDIDFMLFRRTIFEACGMVNDLKHEL